MMIKFSSIREGVKALGTLRTSTGDTFSLESGAEALIKLAYLKAEIEAAEKAIKENFPEGFSYENDLGKIGVVMTAQYSQNITAIISQLTAKGIDWKSLVKFGKTGVDKMTKAVIEANEVKVSESPTFKVTKKVKETLTLDFNLE